jgi:7-cyano-7-deazaguanine synthase in queuosine biosynthesis
MTNRVKIFVSHASHDLWVAKQIASHIRACGAETFLDAENIEHGDYFDDVIVHEANNSSEMLVLFTPVASERKYVWLEIGMFLANQKRIVAVLYGVSKKDLSNDPNMPAILKRIDSVDLNDLDSYLKQLKKRIIKHKECSNV